LETVFPEGPRIFEIPEHRSPSSPGNFAPVSVATVIGWNGRLQGA
jgi:hypothetical protein